MRNYDISFGNSPDLRFDTFKFVKVIVWNAVNSRISTKSNYLGTPDFIWFQNVIWKQIFVFLEMVFL